MKNTYKILYISESVYVDKVISVGGYRPIIEDYIPPSNITSAGREYSLLFTDKKRARDVFYRLFHWTMTLDSFNYLVLSNKKIISNNHSKYLFTVVKL